MANARNWCGILYQENLREDWRIVIGDKLQLPYCYCEHDLDTDTQSEHRKDHVHLILSFPNTTTKNHALNVMKSLSAEGKCCISTCEQVFNMRHMYDYLIHNTESAKKQKKYQYSEECRIAGNGFDIGVLEQMSLAEKIDYAKELTELINQNCFTNFIDFFNCAMYRYNYDSAIFEIIKANSGFFERLTKGHYQRVYGFQSIRQTLIFPKDIDEKSNICYNLPKNSTKFRKDHSHG